jgi:hypothetical protein
MAFPTRHWHVVAGTLPAGGQAAVLHGITVRGVDVLPDVLVKAMSDDAHSGTVNASVDGVSLTATNVYLSNWDPSNQHDYIVLVRKYHSADGSNL